MDENINELLNQLAKGFNVAVEELYPILYKQAIIDGVMSLVGILTAIVLIAGILWGLRHISKKQKEVEEEYKRQRNKWENTSWKDAEFTPYPSRNRKWDWDEPRQMTFVVVSIIIFFLALFAIPLNFENAVTAFFNTEYYMIENILSKLK